MWRIQEYLTCSATSQNFVVPILNERQFPSIEHHAASRVVKNELFATAAIPRDLTQLAADQIACQDSFWCQSDQVSVLEYIYLRYFAIKMRLEDDALAASILADGGLHLRHTEFDHATTCHRHRAVRIF